MFDSVLIANRGEIACRILRTLKRLGVRAIAVYSDADARAQHVHLADHAVHIGGARPAESYLRGERIIEAALATGAQAIHPGFGFLSENADFVEAVEQAGLVFVGPSAASMRKMGSKAGAKLLMAAHGVPVVPGYTGEDQDPERLRREAERIGTPLMIKAAHGGGGKGMRVVHDLDEFPAALASCQREAKNAFGRDRVLLERFVAGPRHIEFQIFGDADGAVYHLYERECSAQRRYQKIIEETPSPFLDPELRARMGEAAVAAGRAIDYRNAGTVEFIVGADRQFYFMEINTRLQVEHPVTEMTLGIDLVEWQLRVAAGERVLDGERRARLVPRGHAIEVRLYAEDPDAGFLPGSGRLELLRLPPTNPEVRIDSGVVEGDLVTVHYDPMIAKLICWGEDRRQATATLLRALADTVIEGPKSNVEFLERLLRHDCFTSASIDTSYLDRRLDEVLGPKDPTPEHIVIAAACLALLREEAATRARGEASVEPGSPWNRADGWRLGHRGKRVKCFEIRAARHELGAYGHGGDYELHLADGRSFTVSGAHWSDGRLSLRMAGRAHVFVAHAHGRVAVIHDSERRYRVVEVSPYAFESSGGGGADQVRAPMPGRIVAVRVAPGEEVREGQEVVVMEAMKMELSLVSPRAGRIAEVGVTVGEFVEADRVLVTLEPAA